MVFHKLMEVVSVNRTTVKTSKQISSVISLSIPLFSVCHVQFCDQNLCKSNNQSVRTTMTIEKPSSNNNKWHSPTQATRDERLFFLFVFCWLLCCFVMQKPTGLLFTWCISHFVGFIGSYWMEIPCCTPSYRIGLHPMVWVDVRFCCQTSDDIRQNCPITVKWTIYFHVCPFFIFFAPVWRSLIDIFLVGNNRSHRMFIPVQKI